MAPQPNSSDGPIPQHGPEWLEAAKRGDLAAMERLFAANHELLFYRGKGCSLGFIAHSALHWAASKGHAPILAWLLGQGASTSLINNAGSRPLHAASQNGKLAAVEALLAAGADPALQDAEGHTARDVALDRSYGAIARVLEAHAGKAALQSKLAVLASSEGGWKVGAMKEVLRLGRVDCAGAAEKSDLEALVRELIASEGVVTADSDGVGGTNGHAAHAPPSAAEPAPPASDESASATTAPPAPTGGRVSYGKPSALDDLSSDEDEEGEAQATLQARRQPREGMAAARDTGSSGGRGPTAPQPISSDGPMPPHGPEWLEAAKHGDLATMERLFAANHELLSYRGKGCSLGFIAHSALHWAASKGHAPILAWLLDQGASTSLINNAGLRPLHAASQNGKLAAVEALLAAGADPALQDAEGHTARDVALDRSYGAIARVLEAHAGKPALQSKLAVLASSEGGWKVGAMKEVLRLGRVDCAGAAEKSDLEALVRELIAREEQSVTSASPTAPSSEARAAQEAAAPEPASPPPAAPAAALAAPSAAAESSEDEDEAVESSKLKAAAERSKAAGNERFSACDFEGAIKHFSIGLRLDPASYVLHSNRSAAFASVGGAQEALADAERCVALAPQWAKGYSRQAAALVLLGRYKDANRAYKRGLELEPDNAGLRQGLESLRAALRQGEVPAGGNASAPAETAQPRRAPRVAPSAAAAPAVARSPAQCPTDGDVGVRWIEAAKAADVAQMEKLLAQSGPELVHHKARGIGHTALHWAAARGEVRLMEWLLSVGAQPNALNTSEATPLHTAAANGQAFAVGLLLSSGVDPAIANDDGETAAQVAVGRARPDLARQIQEHGAAAVVAGLEVAV